MCNSVSAREGFPPRLSLLPGPLMRVVSPLQQGAVGHGRQALHF